MGRELPGGMGTSGGKRAYRCEESFPVGRELPFGKRAFSFPVGRELPGGKKASRWEESFPVGRDLLSRKRASQWEKSFLVGRPRELASKKGAS